MILLYPVLLVALASIVRRHERAAGGRGSGWFLLWALAGIAFLLGLATGFSLGLFSFAVAACIDVAVALASPHWPEAAGFGAGALAAVSFLFWLNGDPGVALVPGALAAALVGLYVALATRRRARGVAQ